MQFKTGTKIQLPLQNETKYFQYTNLVKYYGVKYSCISMQNITTTIQIKLTKSIGACIEFQKGASHQ